VSKRHFVSHVPVEPSTRGSTGRALRARKKPTGRRKASKAEPGKETTETENIEDEDLRALLRQLQKDLRKNRGSCEEADFRRMVDHLSTMVPPPKRCRYTVKRLPSEEMSSEYGYVTKERDKFEIYLDKSMTEYETEHVLLHEWAHMLAWQPYHPLMGDHSANWGVWYSLVWRKYHGCE